MAVDRAAPRGTWRCLTAVAVAVQGARMRTSVARVALAVVLAAVLAGCGGTGGGAPPAVSATPGAGAPASGPTPEVPALPEATDAAAAATGADEADVAEGSERPLDASTESSVAEGGAGAPADAPIVTARDFAFSPGEVPGAPGTTVTVRVVNEGSIPHTFTIDAAGVDELIDPGSAAVVEVELPASLPLGFYCRFHPDGMVGRFVAA